MYSIATGTMPAPMIAATQRLGVLGVVEAEQHRARALRQRQDAHVGLGDDAELALRAADQAEEIEAGGVERGAAEVDDLAVDASPAARRAGCWRSRRISGNARRRSSSPTLPPMVQASCEEGSGA